MIDDREGYGPSLPDERDLYRARERVLEIGQAGGSRAEVTQARASAKRTEAASIQADDRRWDKRPCVPGRGRGRLGRRDGGRRMSTGADEVRQADAEFSEAWARFEEAAGREAPEVVEQGREAAQAADNLHPDGGIITSFPGLGPIAGARVLAEIGDDRSRFRDAKGLKAYAGAAPSPAPAERPGPSRTAASRTTGSPRPATSGRSPR